MTTTLVEDECCTTQAAVANHINKFISSSETNKTTRLNKKLHYIFKFHEVSPHTPQNHFRDGPHFFFKVSFHKKYIKLSDTDSMVKSNKNENHSEETRFCTICTNMQPE